MARFSKIETIKRMLDTKIIPVYYNKDLETLKKIVECCYESNIKIFEFTNRGHKAYKVFSELESFIQKNYPDMILGAGSISDPYTASIYINEGAEFIVGPTLCKKTAKLCNRLLIPYSPGCGSASEILKAAELGCTIIKIFPAGELGGPAFLKSILAPMPRLMIMPTGGVEPTKESLSAWFKAGAVCVGMGSQFIKKDLVDKGDFEKIKEQMKEVINIVKNL